MPKSIKALIFDLEGVVIDTMRSVWIPADKEFCRLQGYKFTQELGRKITGTSLLDGVRIMKDYFGFEGDEQELLKQRLKIVDDFFAKDVEFIDGFTEFITQYSNLPAAVATALKLKYLDIVDNQLELRKIFADHVYSIYEIGDKSKPHPDIFLHAAQKLGIDPANCLVFEDAPNGIEAARRAGMRSVALTTTFSR